MLFTVAMKLTGERYFSSHVDGQKEPCYRLRSELTSMLFPLETRGREGSGCRSGAYSLVIVRNILRFLVAWEVMGALLNTGSTRAREDSGVQGEHRAPKKIKNTFVFKVLGGFCAWIHAI